MIKHILPLLFLLLSINSFSQEFNAILIPAELKENANAIVRNNLVEVFIEDIDLMTVKQKRVITILNKVGDRLNGDLANFSDVNEGITNLLLVALVYVLVKDKDKYG